ncbi:flagellar motor protein MotB [Legionella fairfieldensis]|uniref:flagellar motor protein MotB n=1 Tax=Legionella fairfieldensis TaxID=45064 RepID=UPI00048EA73F|nr:flagellar motor protein MotB [Legionella fairfieldensis]
MAGSNEKNPIIIKIVKKTPHAHHGGSWKIAYADFVTAMMAFFLLLWLLTSVNKAQREGISEYFKQPLKIALIGGDSIGSRKETIQGGGDNFRKRDGQVSADQTADGEKKENPRDIVQEMQHLQQLKANILLTVDQDPSLSDLKNRLLMDVVSEGLRIQLVDNKNKPMFPMGSDQMDPEVEKLLTQIAKLLNTVPNKLNIQGHTDDHPYQNPEDINQSNWELSTQRANAARRTLLKAGVPEAKVMQVTGYASTVLLDKKNPLAPMNRRISIIVMKKAIEDKIIKND